MADEAISIFLELFQSNKSSILMSRRKRRKRKLLMHEIIAAMNSNLRRKTIKIKNYIEIASQYDNETFASYFRMSKNSFEKLLIDLESSFPLGTRRPRISLRASLLITLWSLGNICTCKNVSEKFGVSKGSVIGIVLYMCKILTNMSNLFIKWPTYNEATKIIDKFNTLRGEKSFPGVIGCIDAVHIQISKPPIDPKNYYNQNGFYSLILQAICDNEMRFLDVFFGLPGRNNYARVFNSSSISKKFKENRINVPTDCHLIGNSAYPLNEYLMVPYKDNGLLTTTEKKYNIKLISSRVIIEQAFGMLKARFRRLNSLKILKLQNAKYFVIASIILHNFLINEKDESLDLEYDINREFNAENSNFPATMNEDAEHKRNLIAESL